MDEFFIVIDCRPLDAENLASSDTVVDMIFAYFSAFALNASSSGHSLYAASAPTLQISVDLLKAPFDISGVNITCFMVAGTKKVDAGDGKNSGICPLVELQEKYNSISDSVTSNSSDS